MNGASARGLVYEPTKNAPPDMNIESDVTRAEHLTVEWWFKALDHRRMSIGLNSRTVEVKGIHTDGPDLWIQVEPVGRVSRGVVLRVSRYTTIDQALSALQEAWSGDAADRSVIDARAA